MLKKTLWALGLGSLFISTQIFSDEAIYREPVEILDNLSFLEDVDATNIRNALNRITTGETEDTLDFEKYYDLLNPLMSFNQENRTKCLIVSLSNLKSREFMADLAQQERILQFLLTELNNKKDLLSSLMDKELFKQYLTQLAISLNLDETAVEYHIDHEEYGKLFYDLGIL